MSAENSLRVFEEPPVGDAPPDNPTGFLAPEATVRQVIAWHQNNTSRKVASKPAEIERCRIWKLLCEHRPDAALGTAFGDRPCSRCKPFELLNFINSQPGVRSDWSRKRWNAAIQRPFNVAEKLQLISKNPFRGLTFPEGDQGRDWTDEEFQTVLRNASPPFRRLVVGLRFSGMRPGEGRELSRPWIRIDERKVVIEKHKMRYKTKKPRVIPTNSVLLKLFNWLARHNPPGATCVLLNSFGRPWTRSMACRTLLRIRAKVNRSVQRKLATMRPDGTDPQTGKKIPAKLLVGLPDEVKLHGARHTFITQAAVNGVDMPSVSGIAGHSDLLTTQRYTHVDTKVDHLADAMEQAIHRRPKKAKPVEPPPKKDEPPTPLFDGLG
jgi:integrase